MGLSEQKIHELKTEGYDPVWIHDARPKEEDPDHTHPFDTHLVVLDGEIEIKMDGESMFLGPGDEINISRGKVHYGMVGENGCRYIVAEKH